MASLLGNNTAFLCKNCKKIWVFLWSCILYVGDSCRRLESFQILMYHCPVSSLFLFLVIVVGWLTKAVLSLLFASYNGQSILHYDIFFLYSIQLNFIYKMKDLKLISGSVSNVGQNNSPCALGVWVFQWVIIDICNWFLASCCESPEGVYCCNIIIVFSIFFLFFLTLKPLTCVIGSFMSSYNKLKLYI